MLRGNSKTTTSKHSNQWSNIDVFPSDTRKETNKSALTTSIHSVTGEPSRYNKTRKTN